MKTLKLNYQMIQFILIISHSRKYKPSRLDVAEIFDGSLGVKRQWASDRDNSLRGRGRLIARNVYQGPRRLLHKTERRSRWDVTAIRLGRVANRYANFKLFL